VGLCRTADPPDAKTYGVKAPPRAVLSTREEKANGKGDVVAVPQSRNQIGDMPRAGGNSFL